MGLQCCHNPAADISLVASECPAESYLLGMGTSPDFLQLLPHQKRELAARP